MTSDFFENLLNICPEGVVGNDLEGNVFLFNPSAERILGYSRDEVIGKIRVSSFYPKGGAREVKEFLYSEEYGGRGRLAGFETDLVRKDGRKFPSSLSCVVLTEGGRETGIVGFFSDISARKAAERESLESEKRYRSIVETAGDAILSFDENHGILMANRAAEEMLEYGRGGLNGMNLQRLIPPKYGDSWEQIERYAAAGGAPGAKRSVELSLLAHTGKEIAVQISMAEKEAGGKKIITAIMRDVSARRAMEEELRLLSITDTLTQLFNRRHFHSLADKELDRARRNKLVFALLLVDIDNFKKYNDTYGHTEGDRVLRAMGDVMRKNFRTMDSAFRMGGEEFLVLLPEANAGGGMVAAERLRSRFAGIGFCPVPGEEPVRMTVSVGVSAYHDGDTVEDMVRFADLAMYAAKNGGRNRCVNFEDLRGPHADGVGASGFPG
jgi:diguanylate cyclase (GGDEF)-like protein/PAS domain S-box-containing protein